MTSKDRVMTAVALSRPDRVPMDFNANPATMKRLMEDLGASSLRELLLQLHVDIVDIRGVVDPVYCGPIPKDRNLGGGIKEGMWVQEYDIKINAEGYAPQKIHVWNDFKAHEDIITLKDFVLEEEKPPSTG